MKAIWWIRRDLRLNDNPALLAALRHGTVIPVFVRDPGLSSTVSARRQAFLWNGLRVLDSDLRARGSRLIIKTGKPIEVLHHLLHASGARAIYAEEDFTPYALRRDLHMKRSLPLELVQGQLVHHPLAISKADGTPYMVFTPFSKNWKASLPRSLTPFPAPTHLLPPPAEIKSERLPEIPENEYFPAGESRARRRLEKFVSEKRIDHYHNQRDRVDLDGTSSLSPYLHFGMLGLRETVHHALQNIRSAKETEVRLGAETWLNELIWREFYIHILYHFPYVRKGSFHRKYNKIRWSNDEDDFEAWKSGETGYPIVDAAMRQLNETGWMHNRARMIVASFLVKDLLIDWRWGEAWFMEQLLDADIAANNGGWQWTAGVGTDAAPYFRIFNPVSQSQKFDPNGDYIRKWVPELAHLTGKAIHAPWEHAGKINGYPRPIINHQFARARTLAAYQLLR